MMRSGRMRNAFFTKSFMLISPVPSMLGGRTSKRSQCSNGKFNSAVSSIESTRSRLGMKEHKTLSVVVLPDAVPPEIRVFAGLTPRPSVASHRNAATSKSIVPTLTRSTTLIGSWRNLRRVRVAPSKLIGGRVALTRVPSGRRASRIGTCVSILLPMLRAIRSMTSRMSSSS